MSLGSNFSKTIQIKLFEFVAAHCFKRIPSTWEVIGVRLGEWDISKSPDCSKDDPDFCAEPTLDFEISKTILHENYKKAIAAQHYDIALIRLKGTVEEFTRFVQPICLPLDPQLWNRKYENSFTAVGWGNLK